MNSNQVQDIRLMYEAVYNDDLREKADEYNYSVHVEDIVEVATEYFYTYGLNESGIDILIEKVGLENFVDFVYSLSEELVVDLEEAKRSKAKKQPTSMLTRQRAKLAAQRAAKERTETERKEPESKGADTEAKAEQPKSRKPEKGGIGRAITGAIERAKKDIELTKKTARTIAKAYNVGVEGLNTASDSRLARQARVATHKGVKRHTQALKDIGGTLGRTLGASTARRMAQEEDFEYVLDYLISEGYADTHEDAFAIMANMSEEWKDSIFELYKGRHGQSETEYMDDRSDAGKRISGDSRTGPRYYTLGHSRVNPDEPTKPGQKPRNTPKLAKWEKTDIQYRRAKLRRK